MTRTIFSYTFLPILMALYACNGGGQAAAREETAKVSQLSVGIQNSPSNALVIIANEKHLFDSTKVKVSVQEFAAGKLALQAMLGQANDVDIAVSAETPVVLSSLAGNKLKVIGQVVNATNECRVVVRKEGNMDTPEKYFAKKRKIATSQGGSPEWSTYNFIQKHKLKDKVEVLAMDPPSMPAALANASVEGISIFDPFARMAEKELGDKGLTFLNADLHTYYIMSVKETVASEKAAEISAYLEGLKKAVAFIQQNPAEAQAIVARKTKLDAGIVASTWANYSFGVAIDPALKELCVAEANWAIATNKYPKETKIPDFGALMK